MRKGALLGFLVYMVFGLYLFNMSLGLIILPEIVSKADKWIILIGSILIFIGAVNYLRVCRVRKLKDIKFN